MKTKTEAEATPKPYQPKTGERCHCRPGVWRDNCPDCEGTGQRIDFAAIRARRHSTAAITANWHQAGRYYATAIAGRILTSVDGNEWMDTATHELAEFSEFEAATIRLEGGPHDGEIVA